MSTTTLPANFAVLQEIEEREPHTYDKRTGLYLIQRRFAIVGGTDLWAANFTPLAQFAGVTIPASFQLPYTEDATGATMVTMLPVTRHVHDMAQKPDGTFCGVLSITYEGHACMMPESGKGNTTSTFNGVVSSHLAFGTKSEPITISFDKNADGDRIPIGTLGESEGTNRLVGNIRLVIVQNLTEVDYWKRFPLHATMTGLLNEDKWADPVSNAAGVTWAWDEGTWLYLGPENTENRDGTYTLQHQFEYDRRPMPNAPTTFYDHKFLWYTRQPQRVIINGVAQIIRVPVNPPTLATIYLTAGPTVALAHLFADLFRPLESLP